MESNKESKGLGFSFLLGIVFVILKLCGAITWSWVWVLAPIWIDVLLSIVVILIVLFIAWECKTFLKILEMGNKD